MQTFYANGLQRLLHPEKDRTTAAGRIMTSLSRPECGTANRTAGAAGLDSFTVTRQISELLSPACGMSEEEKSSYLAKIMAKLKSGKRLTAEEMRFLQAENPVLYQQAAQIQAMRESLETRLAHCSSREEAEQIYTCALSSVSEEDPMKEYLVAAYDDVYREFRESGAYQTLPETNQEEEQQADCPR